MNLRQLDLNTSTIGLIFVECKKSIDSPMFVDDVIASTTDFADQAIGKIHRKLVSVNSHLEKL
jgi:hypothetical protein